MSDNVSIILAERVLVLFKESGTTPREQQTALDIVRTVTLDSLYLPTETEKSDVKDQSQ
jgi:hypothetical protein